MQEVLGEEAEAESCEDEMTATEPSPAEAEAELPELQSQVGMNFVFLSFAESLLSLGLYEGHCQASGRPCLPRKKNLLLLFLQGKQCWMSAV